jgi:hypothetical protein
VRPNGSCRPKRTAGCSGGPWRESESTSLLCFPGFVLKIVEHFPYEPFVYLKPKSLRYKNPPQRDGGNDRDQDAQETRHGDRLYWAIEAYFEEASSQSRLDEYEAKSRLHHSVGKVNRNTVPPSLAFSALRSSFWAREGRRRWRGRGSHPALAGTAGLGKSDQHVG